MILENKRALEAIQKHGGQTAKELVRFFKSIFNSDELNRKDVNQTLYSLALQGLVRRIDHGKEAPTWIVIENHQLQLTTATG